MSNRRQVFYTANLLALLEASSLGLDDVTEDERARAAEIVERVTQRESRKWRARRRPSRGRSKPLRARKNVSGGPECD